ncbi:HNH endonuclease [Corynebacterium sp. CCUG 59401]|nr:HNH endonuclease [Corynebacterium pseudogenitalium]
MAGRIAQLVDTIGDALAQLRDEFADPSLLSLHDVAAEMEKLEEHLNAKALIDASFAYLCDRDNAGRLVGAVHPNAYLTTRLGLSAGEAYDRLARGRDLFAPPVTPEPADTGGDDDGSGGSGFELEFGTDNAETEQARREAEEQARRSQEEARTKAAGVSAEKQNIIRRELDKLLAPAHGERTRIHAQAMDEAATRDVKDLRMHVRRNVDAANRKHAPRNNPNAGFANRAVHIGHRKADGTHEITITATAGDTALFKAHLDKGLAPHTNTGDAQRGTDGAGETSGVTDYRTPPQRHYDQFTTILKAFESGQQKLSGGAASVVIAMTMDDLADTDGYAAGGGLFATNTGIDIDVIDMARLGLGTLDTADSDQANFILQLDSVTAVPLSMGKTRTASIGQRIAMLAVQGVCSWTGCTKPLTECEAHHIFAWILGGLTTMDNLTGLCRQHHRCNNDNRDGTWGKGHMDYDPDTGQAGLVTPGATHMQFNTTDPAHHCAANRIRRRTTTTNTGTGTGTSGPTTPTPKTRPDPPLFPPNNTPTRTRKQPRPRAHTHARE